MYRKGGEALCVRIEEARYARQGGDNNMSFILWLAVCVGVAGIGYTAYGLVRLTDYFNEVYGYDRNSHT